MAVRVAVAERQHADEAEAVPRVGRYAAAHGPGALREAAQPHAMPVRRGVRVGRCGSPPRIVHAEAHDVRPDVERHVDLPRAPRGATRS